MSQILASLSQHSLQLNNGLTGQCLQASAAAMMRKNTAGQDLFFGIKESLNLRFRQNKMSHDRSEGTGAFLVFFFAQWGSFVNKFERSISQSYQAVGTGPFLGFFTSLHFTSLHCCAVLLLSLSCCRDSRPWCF